MEPELLEVDSATNPSYTESVFSRKMTLSTGISQSFGDEVCSAKDEIVELFLGDEEFKKLFEKAVTDQNIGGEKLARNFSRLLVEYSTDLLRLADLKVYRESAKLIGSSAEYISNRIRWSLEPMPKALPSINPDEAASKKQSLNNWLETMISSESELPRTGGSAEESHGLGNVGMSELEDQRSEISADHEESEEGILEALEQIKGFLKTGSPIENLKRGLRNFVTPRIPKAWNRNDDSSSGIRGPRIIMQERVAREARQREEQERLEREHTLEAQAPGISPSGIRGPRMIMQECITRDTRQREKREMREKRERLPHEYSAEDRAPDDSVSEMKDSRIIMQEHAARVARQRTEQERLEREQERLERERERLEREREGLEHQLERLKREYAAEMSRTLELSRRDAGRRASVATTLAGVERMIGSIPPGLEFISHDLDPGMARRSVSADSGNPNPDTGARMPLPSGSADQTQASQHEAPKGKANQDNGGAGTVQDVQDAESTLSVISETNIKGTTFMLLFIGTF
jgi:hypothetical protein